MMSLPLTLQDFTPTERGRVKQKCYRRNVFWTLISMCVAAGHAAATAVDKVCFHYGRDHANSRILDMMLEDRKRHKDDGRYHPALRIGPRLARRQLTHLSQGATAQPQQGAIRRHMIEARAAPTQRPRAAPLARLQQRARQDIPIRVETAVAPNGDVTTRQMADL